MIPPFSEKGWLPPGIHPATVGEVEKRYGTNKHRKRLIGGLKRGLDALRVAGCRRVYLDGSFVTNKPTPGDYDACYEMAGMSFAKLDPVLKDFSNERAAHKAKFFGEFLPAHDQAEGPPLYTLYINWFQRDGDSGEPKGILQIDL